MNAYPKRIIEFKRLAEISMATIGDSRWDACLSAGLSIEDSITVIKIADRCGVSVAVVLQIVAVEAKPAGPGITAEELEKRVMLRE